MAGFKRRFQFLHSVMPSISGIIISEMISAGWCCSASSQPSFYHLRLLHTVLISEGLPEVVPDIFIVFYDQ